jgi:hypothetical protein
MPIIDSYRGFKWLSVLVAAITGAIIMILPLYISSNLSFAAFNGILCDRESSLGRFVLRQSARENLGNSLGSYPRVNLKSLLRLMEV